MTKDGGMAFPGRRYEQGDTGGVRNDVPMAVEYPGMSLRDWFAGQALAGVLLEKDARDNPSMAAVWAYDFADEMLAARKT